MRPMSSDLFFAWGGVVSCGGMFVASVLGVLLLFSKKAKSCYTAKKLKRLKWLLAGLVILFALLFAINLWTIMTS